MKKKIENKMELKKITVSNLNHEEKKKIKGGISILHITCDCNTDHESCSLQVNCCPPPLEKRLIMKDSEVC